MAPNNYKISPDADAELSADAVGATDALLIDLDAGSPDVPDSGPGDSAAVDIGVPDAPGDHAAVVPDVAADERVTPVDMSPPPPDLPPPVCAADERKCEGDTAMKCRLDRGGFEVAEVCAGRVPYCYQGQCTGCGGGKGVCGDGLCPLNCPNETPTACFGDCATLPEGEVRTGGTGIISRTNLWGECGPYQALIGVFSGDKIAVTCSFDRAAYAHKSSDCRTVDYAEDPHDAERVREHLS